MYHALVRNTRFQALSGVAAITTDVLAEIAWDLAASISDLDVRTSGGFVTLSGTTATYTSKDAARNAAFRVQSSDRR